MRTFHLIAGLAALGAIAIGGAPQAQAAPLLLWGNNATSGPDYVEAFDPATGAVVHQFNVDPGGATGTTNGRGVVIVGGIGYATNADNGVIQEFNSSTGALLGTLNTGHGAIANITYDGTGFWASDYTGNNNVYHILLNGTTDKTITLGNCGGFCDGLNYYIDPISHEPRLISNEGDGETPATYDIYDTNGNLITSHLFNTGSLSGTGVAFNPFDDEFYVSNIYQDSISTYSLSGAFIATIPLGTPIPPCGACRLIEGLSFDYTQTLPTPEPASLTLLGGALVMLGAIRRRRKTHVK
jgi:hypothetical protein